MWHMTCETLHVTRDSDKWHVTRLVGEPSLKISAPYFLLFVIYDIMKIWRKRLT